MITKTTIAAAAIATAIAATPASIANAGGLNFSFGVQTDHGSLYIGDGPGWGNNHGGGGAYSCHEARQTLKWDFKKVQKVECNGGTYTFKVKNKHIGPWKFVKFNKWNGNYWFA